MENIKILATEVSEAAAEVKEQKTRFSQNRESLKEAFIASMQSKNGEDIVASLLALMEVYDWKATHDKTRGRLSIYEPQFENTKAIAISCAINYTDDLVLRPGMFLGYVEYDDFIINLQRDEGDEDCAQQLAELIHSSR